MKLRSCLVAEKMRTKKLIEFELETDNIRSTQLSPMQQRKENSESISFCFFSIISAGKRRAKGEHLKMDYQAEMLESSSRSLSSSDDPLRFSDSQGSILLA